MITCWANSTNQCGTKLTGEHLISNAILGKKIVVQGFSWCKDNPMLARAFSSCQS